MSDWECFIDQIVRKYFDDATLDDYVTKKVRACRLNDPVFVKQKDATPLEQCPKIVREKYAALCADYDIKEIAETIERLGMVSGRMFERICNESDQLTNGRFYRKFDTEKKRYVIADASDPESQRFDIGQSYKYNMLRYTKEWFAVFSRGCVVEHNGMKVSVCKYRVYGWAIYNGLIEYMEKMDMGNKTKREYGELVKLPPRKRFKAKVSQ